MRWRLPHPLIGFFTGAVSLWLWFTVLFANFAEAMAEGRGKAQAETLRRTRTDATAKKLQPDGQTTVVSATVLRRGDLVLVEAGDLIPGDGEVIEGVASVNEAAITGESAPVIKEPGTDIRSSVTGGTTIVSDWLKIRITANPGETFIDRMISLVEGANRQKTPNEIALNILLASLTIIFLLAVYTLQPFAIYSGSAVAVTTLVALLGVSHSHDDRWTPFRYRDRRDGPARPVQRAGHEWTGGRSGGRCRYSAARQDRNHHFRQPHGMRISSRRAVSRGRCCQGGSAVEHRR